MKLWKQNQHCIGDPQMLEVPETQEEMYKRNRGNPRDRFMLHVAKLEG